MKVGYLVSLKRGLPVFTYREVKAMLDRGVDVNLYSIRNGEGVAMPDPDWPVHRIKLLGLLFAHFATVIHSPIIYLISIWESLREMVLPHFAIAVYFARLMRRDKMEVIYCFEGKHALWIAYYIRRWLLLPVVVIVHAEMVTARDHFAITKRAAHLCSKIITISEYNKRRLIERYGLPEEKIEVVRLWSPYRPDKRIKVMIVGMWTDRKGHEVLLDVFESLDPEKYVLWVVGGGIWRGEFYDVAAEVKRRGVEDRVVLWGRVLEEMLKVLYQSCDIFALPSRTTNRGTTEGIPVSLIEAMSYGCPTVSTYHTGIPELVEEILIEENNAEQLREALETLGQNLELRRRLGRRNQEIIRERYSEGNVDRIKDVLEGVLKGVEISG